MAFPPVSPIKDFLHLARSGGGTETPWPLPTSTCYRKEMIETHSNMIKRMTTWHPKLGFKATALLGT